MRRRQGIVVLALVGLTGLVLLTGCGRMPPADYWTWSAQDSTKVMDQVQNWKVAFKVTFAEDPILSDRVTYVPETTKTALRLSMRENKFKFRFFPRTFSHTLAADSLVDSTYVVKDTTVDVRLREGLAGKVTIVTDSVTLVRNPDTVINGMHYKVYDSTFTARETTIVEKLEASGDRYLHFEPADKTKRDSWYLKRMSGGEQIALPDDATAPYLGGLQIVAKAGRRDTFVLRPDTLHRGIQSLCDMDRMLTYTTADTIVFLLDKVALLGHLWWDPGDVWAFIHVPHPTDPTKSVRRILRPLPGDTASVTFATPGLRHVYIELVPRISLTEIAPKFVSRIWAIPLDIKSAP
jgi:hypothetical protein